jgi:hypothetical protein
MADIPTPRAQDSTPPELLAKRDAVQATFDMLEWAEQERRRAENLPPYWLTGQPLGDIDGQALEYLRRSAENVGRQFPAAPPVEQAARLVWVVRFLAECMATPYGGDTPEARLGEQLRRILPGGTVAGVIFLAQSLAPSPERALLAVEGAP